MAGVLVSAGLIGVASVGVTTPSAGAAIVNDQPVSGVASPMWQTNNTVWAMDVRNNVVYAGGEFTSVRPPGNALGSGEVTRNRIAAFNATTGDLITTFNPNANGMIYDLDVSNDGTKLYVAGSFTTIGGQTRQRVARLNLPSGTVDTAWQANANAIVATVISDNNNVYIGGDFTTVKGVNRTRIAKLNTTNGDVVTAFNASADKRITESAIAPDGSRVLVGGENDVVDNQPQTAIASLNPTTGALMPWAATGIVPRPTNGGCTGMTVDIQVSGSIAYVAAGGVEPGCYEGYYAANISDGSVIYNERCLGESVGTVIANGWVYRGSHNHDCAKNVGGYVGPNNANDFIWYRLEAHRLSDGRLGHWSPTTNGGSPGTSTTVGPQILATDGTNIYVGGDFSTVNQQAQQGLTRFMVGGGNAAPEVPAAPRVTATAAGTLEISAEGVRDNDDGQITMNLYRDGGTTPIATQTRETWPWSRAVYRFKDTGLTAGTAHTYTLAASDGSLTSAQGPASLPVTVGWQNPPVYPTAVATAGSAAAYWRLDDASGPVADSSGNGETGNIVGGVATGQAGDIIGNNAVATNGVDGFLTSSTTITPTPAFTNSVWFNTTTERGGAIMGFSDAQTGVGLRDNRALWMDNDGKLAFGIRRGNANNPTMSFVRSAGTYNDGNWHQAVTVFDGTSTITLYVDGSLVATLAITQPIIPGPGYLRVGYMDLSRYYTVFGSNFDGNPAVMSYFWQGRADEALMQNAALTADQVKALYASGSAYAAALPPEQPEPPPPPPPPPPSALPAAVAADAPSLYWRLNELSEGTVADSSAAHNRPGTYRTGLNYGVAGALTDGTTAVQSPGVSGVAYSNNQFTNPQVFSLEVYLKTTNNGGKILGLENAQTGSGTTYDRQLYMSAGRIYYGIRSGGVMQVIQSANTYNDGVFHQVVATQGPAGMNLYVDGALIGTNATVAPDAANGFWRLGGGNLAGWPNAPGASALGGTYDEVAVFPTQLAADRVLAHYNASKTAGVVQDPPTNVHTTAVTGTTANLAWDVPAGTITSYRVFRNGALRGTVTVPAFNDTGLTSGQTYSYTVTAVSSNGESAPSTALSVTTPDVVAPSVPANLQAPTVNVNQVVLTWNNSSDNVGIPTYDVLRDGVLLGNVSTNTYTDSTVAANTTYSYTVQARDAAGNVSAPSTARVVTTPAVGDGTPPSVPQNLHTTSVAGTSIGLAWDASIDDTGVTAYIVSRNGVDLPATAGTTLTDSSLASGVTYSYTVRARDAALNTSAASSPPLVVTTPDVVAPSQPTGLSAPTVSATSVSLTWNTSSDNVGVTAYDVRRNGNLIGSPGTNAFTDNTVTTGQTYSYTVTARDAAGNTSAASTALNVTAVNPDPSLFSDQFTGATGAAWGAGWTTSVSGGTATQQTGTGQLACTDVAGAFSQALLSGLAARSDSETLFSYQFNSTTAIAYFSAYARGSGGWQNGYRPRNGYGIELRSNSGTIEVIRNVNGTTTTLATVSGARQVSTAKQWVRLRVVGTTIQFRTWVDGQAEPATWNSTLTDSSVTAPGQLHLSVTRGGANVGAKDVRIDDLSVTSGS